MGVFGRVAGAGAGREPTARGLFGRGTGVEGDVSAGRAKMKLPKRSFRMRKALNTFPRCEAILEEASEEEEREERAVKVLMLMLGTGNIAKYMGNLARRSAN